MISGLLIDLSGVLYVGNQAVPGAIEALKRLQECGLPYRFLTNTTRSPKQKILHQLNGMGFDVRAGQVFTAPEAARTYLEQHVLKPYLLIHPGLKEEFPRYPREQCNAVLLGDAGEAFTYNRLNKAFRVLMEGAPLIAMGDNRYFRETDGLSLDAGPFVKALEYASGQQAIITGKPSGEFFRGACRELGCDPGEVMMIGDDVESDVLGAIDSGLQAILVRTGKYQPADEDKLQGTEAAVFENFSAAIEAILAG